MTSDTDRQAQERLRQLLAAYGADRIKWPEPDRARFADDAPDEMALSDEITDARQVDLLLSHATAPAPDTSAATRIAERILQEAEVPAPDNIFEFTAQGAARGQTRPRSRIALWPDTALIAASLIVGVVLGQSDLLTEIGFGFGLTGASTVEELGNAVLGLNIDSSLISEDML